jgi:Fic family protein
MFTENLQYDKHKPFNQLPLLPPPEDRFLTIGVLTKLAKVHRALGKLDGISLRLPNPNMLVNTISLQEAKSSSEIENIFTTDDELYKAISDKVKEQNANPSTKEVLRYREALWAGYNKIKEGNKIQLGTIIEIYQQIKQTSLGIRSPHVETIIKKTGMPFAGDEIIYTPPRGEGIIESKLKNLFEFINNNKYLYDPLIKLALSHYQFEAIHPFTDGNGRTGRVLNLMMLIQNQLLTHPILYLSKFIIDTKDDYYKHLRAVTQTQSWQDWTVYIINGIEQTSYYTISLIESITGQMNETYEYAKKKLSFINKDIIEAIFTQPYIRRETIAKITGKKSRTTSTKYMQDLCNIGILEAKKEGRDVFYVNNDLVNILAGG